VTFYFSSPNAVSAETRHLMRLVADQMAASAYKARLIEDLRRANLKLTASNEELERQFADLLEARRVKDEFLSNISHELRTPLTAVIGYISLMQEGLAGPVSAEQQDTLGTVKESSEHLLSLIGDLLDLTALKRGTVEAMAEELDPRDPLRDAVLAAKGKRESVALVVDAADLVELPVLRSDRRTVARALTALLDNAFKFTREGRVKVSLELIGNRVAYTVSDTGIGIPEAEQRLVFDEFRQVDGTTTREYGGAGLGLALARRLARLVQGDITLTSTPGAGSSFQLEVPIRLTR
jgi:signal transduction histidine kinase